MNKILEWLRRLLLGRPPAQALLAPAYDEETRAMAGWVKSWRLANIPIYTGGSVTHGLATSLLGSDASVKLLVFVGHGSAGGLLTKRGQGKASSPICHGRHECLLDSDDLKPFTKNAHVVAWACDAGGQFGRRVASLKGSAFLGFDGALNLVINDDPSEKSVWSPTLRALVERVRDRGRVDSSDGDWLRAQLLARHRDIRDRKIDTGKHNPFNSMFLKRAAKRLRVYP